MIMAPGLLTPLDIPAVLLDMSIAFDNDTSTIAGYPLGVFDQNIVGLANAGAYASGFTMGIRSQAGYSVQDLDGGSARLTGTYQDSVAVGFYLLQKYQDDPGYTTILPTYLDPTPSVTFTFLNCSGDARRNGSSDLSLSNPLQALAANTYALFMANGILMMWPRNLTVSEMDEVYGLCTP